MTTDAADALYRRAAGAGAGEGLPPSTARDSRDELIDLWSSPPGLRRLSAVNHTPVGLRFVVTGLVVFLIAGVLALLIRTQLIVPNNTFLGHDAYNQIFTVHGTAMMFLFAVPIVEGAAIYLLPLMLGARDLPFPRLGAFGYWCYLFGSVLVLSSLLMGLAPDGGWFIYPPLSGPIFSPDKNIDFWLLGITFVEISAISAAVELIVAIFRTRAPGMSIDRMPLLAWYVLVTAFMIAFGFPPLLLGSILYELERAFGWPFYEVAGGGDPILWQHLFWLFGHPEVYIIFLPAVGLLSMIVPTFARRPMVGYYWFVLAAIGTGFLSFGLWVHHMYTVGIPQLSLAFFSAASMLVAIPSGIQVFALIGTLWRGRPLLRTPLLYVIGFVIIFTLGGFTGVMIAAVPFDMVVHDTQFIVAHFHYVLIGGVVFPLFAGLYYWLPLATGRMPSERLGRWSFWVMFVGFNVGFMPLHHTGLVGMPRRVFVYPDGLGWEWTNLAASVGAYIFAVGVLLTVVNVIQTWRRGAPCGDNPWNAGTLEWLRTPPPVYNFRSIPPIEGRDPVWEQPGLAEDAERGRFYLADPLDGRRLTMGSSMVDARPELLIELPGPTYIPILSALCISLFFVGFLAELYALSAVGAALTLVAVVVWMWGPPDRSQPRRPLPAGLGVELPLGHGLHQAPAWTALVVTLAIDAALFASLVFSYLYLWSFAAAWPPTGLLPPDLGWASGALAALIASSAALVRAEAAIRRGDRRDLALWLVVGAALGVAYLVVQMLDVVLGFGFAPTDHAYASLSYTLFGYQAFHLLVALVMVGMALVRAWRGDFAPDRHLAVRIATRFWHYSVGLWLVGFVLIYLSPILF